MIPATINHGPGEVEYGGSPFNFTGEQLDDNGLLYLRARYYHPALGVFTGLDPIENLNRYQYVNANPVNMVDPSGLQSEENDRLACETKGFSSFECKRYRARGTLAVIETLENINSSLTQYRNTPQNDQFEVVLKISNGQCVAVSSVFYQNRSH